MLIAGKFNSGFNIFLPPDTVKELTRLAAAGPKVTVIKSDSGNTVFCKMKGVLFQHHIFGAAETVA